VTEEQHHSLRKLTQRMWYILLGAMEVGDCPIVKSQYRDAVFLEKLGLITTVSANKHFHTIRLTGLGCEAIGI
jgi:hypothetical protein